MSLSSETPPSVTSSVNREGIGRIQFSNPASRNALSTKVLGALEKAFVELVEQRVRVVTLCSDVRQGVWSAGHDIRELTDDRDPVGSGKPLERAIQRIRSYPGVVIAMVSGSVWGGAVDLAMSCDLVIADDSASFSMTPANIGLPYTMSGLLRFINNFPVHVLKELFFTTLPLDATRAERLGVINRLVSKEQLEATTLELAMTIACKAPLAIQAVKEQLRVFEDMQPLPVDAMERIAELRRHAIQSADFTEGLKAFAERRKPDFG